MASFFIWFGLFSALHDVDSALANRDQGAISRDLIGYGVLKAPLQGGVFEGIFAPFNAHALDSLRESKERKIAEAASGDQGTGGMKIANAVVSVGNDGMDSLLGKVLQKGKIGQGMVQATVKTSDDNDLIGSLFDGGIHRQLSIGKILFRGNLEALYLLGDLTVSERIKISQQNIGGLP